MDKRPTDKRLLGAFFQDQSWEADHITFGDALSYNNSITYSKFDSELGALFVAWTEWGLCYVGFSHQDEHQTLYDAQKRFPNATWQYQAQSHQYNWLMFKHRKLDGNKPFALHLMGTAFQQNVWCCLLRIPVGFWTTYGDLAVGLDKPKASRAVGRAVGANPLSIIVPCHRVFAANGDLHGYYWGLEKKSTLLKFEAAITNSS